MMASICGAKTRAGTPCKRTDLYASGRCRLHGGLSTGPRTQAGKERIKAGQLRRRAREEADRSQLSDPIIEDRGSPTVDDIIICGG